MGKIKTENVIVYKYVNSMQELPTTEFYLDFEETDKDYQLKFNCEALKIKSQRAYNRSEMIEALSGGKNSKEIKEMLMEKHLKANIKIVKDE